LKGGDSIPCHYLTYICQWTVLARFNGSDVSGDLVFVDVRIGLVVGEAVEVVEFWACGS
jgi:hypothetical protein